MKISIIQLLVEGAEPKRNIERAIDYIEKNSNCDLALLPETLDFGWTHPSGLVDAMPIPGIYSDLFCELAKRKNIWICLGLTEKTENGNYNTSILIDRNGEIVLKHRKVNLLEVEFPFYKVGQKREVIDTEFGKIGLNICADNYYDALYIGNTLAAMGAQLILSPSSWTVSHEITENTNPYKEKWLKPFSYLASKHNLIVAATTAVGYIIGGPYVGMKMIGKSLVVGPDGIISEGIQNEFATEVVNVELQLPFNPKKGEQMGKYLNS